MKNSSKVSIIAIVLLLIIVSCIAGNTVYAAESAISVTNVEVSEKSETTEISKTEFENLSISANAVFHKVGDYVKYKVTIKNSDTQNYKIKSVSSDDKNDFLTYEYSDYSDKAFNAGETADFLVTIKYAKEAGEAEERVQDTTVEISITLENEEGKVVVEPIILNPKTGDTIITYVVMLLVSAIALVTISIRSIKGKKVKTVLAIALALVVVTPAAVHAAKASLVINLKNVISLNDKVTITYTDVSGKEKTKVVAYGSTTDVPEELEKEGYNFDGWMDESGNLIEEIQNIKGDLKLTPKFSAKEYTITYELDGGTAENPSKYTIESNDITLAQPTKTGYDFAGWVGDNGNTPQKEVTIAKGSKGNKSYTATWTIIEYKITYNLDGGTITGQPTTYNIDTDTFTLPKPTKEDWVFIGWTGTGLDSRTRDVTITKGSTGDRSYTANWSKGAPKQIDTYHPSSSDVYMFFGAFTAEWKSTDETNGTYEWKYDCPALLFETDITRARLGFSKTEYVTYNYQREGLGFVLAANKKRMWFSDDYGAPSDGYYTVGYTTESIDHEMRFRVVDGQIKDLQMIY